MMMDGRHLEELAAAEGHYWWNVAKTRLVQELLARFAPAPGRLVEGGVGACGNLQRFRDLGYDVVGLDTSPDAVAHGLARGLDVRVHDLMQPWPVEAGSAWAVVLLDVIEHLEDPVAALQRARDTLSARGCLFVTVPAYPWLMGPWDRMLGHKRRYTRNSLLEHARRAGLVATWLSHWNLVTLPAALTVRVIERFTTEGRGAQFPKVPDFLNATLQGLSGIERRLLRVVPAPAGVSIVGVFTR